MKPLPTRESLLQALKEDLESFEFLSSRLMMGSIDARNCIDDAIARINDMLNVDNASRMGGAGSDYDRGVIDGLKKSLELMSQEESIDFGPGKILRKIEELEKGNVLDQPAPEAHGGT